MGGLAMVPRSSLGGRRPWWRSAAPGEAIFVGRLFRALPPLGFGLDLLPEVRLGPNFERFLERCPLDSKFSCDNIWVSKCKLFLRSSNLFDGWLNLPPLRHAL